MEAKQAKLVLESMGVLDWSGVYVLGCIDRRITIYSQQVRALNLAAALFAAGRVAAGDEVVVVGAGAAGLTCAAGLSKLGARVTVLEQASTILQIFNGKSTRWLHPGVYDWPLAGWSRDSAGLPILDWQHGSIGDVRTTFEASWQRLVELHRINACMGVSQVRLGNAGDQPRKVTWLPSGSLRTRTVILAVGFGLEPAHMSTEHRYWEGDDLDAARIDGKVRRWLVSGCGDGALIDLLRLCLNDFRHHTMLKDFTRDGSMREVLDQIRRIEADAEIQDNADKLHDAYAELEAPWVVDAMKGRHRQDTKVTLNAPNADFLTRDASVLNRFLTAQLYRAGLFELLPGTLTNVTSEGGDGMRVTFADKTSALFDRIVRRHGPNPALANFPLIQDAVESDRKLRRAKPTLTDHTRTRYWAVGTFGPEEREVKESNELGHDRQGTEQERFGSTVPSAASELMIGEQVDHYRVQTRLGAGSIGSVYKAEHVSLGRVHALKVLHGAVLAVREQPRLWEHQ